MFRRSEIIHVSIHLFIAGFLCVFILGEDSYSSPSLENSITLFMLWLASKEGE